MCCFSKYSINLLIYLTFIFLFHPTTAESKFIDDIFLQNKINEQAIDSYKFINENGIESYDAFKRMLVSVEYIIYDKKEKQNINNKSFISQTLRMYIAAIAATLYISNYVADKNIGHKLRDDIVESMYNNIVSTLSVLKVNGFLSTGSTKEYRNKVMTATQKAEKYLYKFIHNK